nr:helix-turn-helix transcriptional regulator [Clostridia bacterium]
MMYLAENLKKYRLLKNLTQEDIAEYLNITPQSVSKWERSESYPDIT